MAGLDPSLPSVPCLEKWDAEVIAVPRYSAAGVLTFPNAANF